MTMALSQVGQVTNPGSALGEAIGALLEEEIHRIMRPLAQRHGCIYVTTGPQVVKTGKFKKLILTDSDGNDYNIDAVIINPRFQPLVLLESKYIRYKKHNRDKASWICTAHPKLRERYATIRKSIAVLMGNWSRPSKGSSAALTLSYLRFRLQIYARFWRGTVLSMIGTKRTGRRLWQAGPNLCNSRPKHAPRLHKS